MQSFSDTQHPCLHLAHRDQVRTRMKRSQHRSDRRWLAADAGILLIYVGELAVGIALHYREFLIYAQQ